MKQTLAILTIVVATLLLTLLPSPRPRSEKVVERPPLEELQRETRQLSERQQARIERREARRAEYVKFIDSIVMAHSYRFIPQTMQVEPAGQMHTINNAIYELQIQPDFTDIHLPYMRGIMPPYKMVVINTILNSVNDYTVSQTDNGWEITFSSWLYGANNYEFTLEITSTTGNAQLTIENTFYSTVTYWGSILGIY